MSAADLILPPPVKVDCGNGEHLEFRHLTLRQRIRLAQRADEPEYLLAVLTGQLEPTGTKIDDSTRMKNALVAKHCRVIIKQLVGTGDGDTGNGDTGLLSLAGVFMRHLHLTLDQFLDLTLPQISGLSASVQYLLECEQAERVQLAGGKLKKQPQLKMPVDATESARGMSAKEFMDELKQYG